MSDLLKLEYCEMCRVMGRKTLAFYSGMTAYGFGGPLCGNCFILHTDEDVSILSERAREFRQELAKRREKN